MLRPMRHHGGFGFGAPMTPDVSPERAFEEAIKCAPHHAANVISAASTGKFEVRDVLEAVPR